MAKVLFNFALLVSLILIMGLAESRVTIGGKFKWRHQASSKLACDIVVGVKSGDTCFGIALSNNLTATAFGAINPNLNCTALFVGQWLCVDGSIN